MCVYIPTWNMETLKINRKKSPDDGLENVDKRIETLVVTASHNKVYSSCPSYYIFIS